jgi:ElaB/YqjD/DUF883 family membrane-anchored ribosome-binding protein
MTAGEKLEAINVEQTSEAAGEEAKPADINALASQTVDAVQKAVDDLTELLSSHAPEAVAALKEASKAAGENIGDLAHELKDDAREIGRARLDDLSVAVRRNPLTALAIAAGVGLIVGLWNNRGGRP